MPVSPNVLNHYIGKGKGFWTPVGGVERELGNILEFEITPETETLAHFSHQSGVRTKDLEITLEQSAELRIVMDEYTAENFQLMLMTAAPVLNSEGNKEVDLFDVSKNEGRLVFQGLNDQGPRIIATFHKLSFQPSGTVGLISDEFGNLELTGEILKDSGVTDKFATFEFLDAEEVSD